MQRVLDHDGFLVLTVPMIWGEHGHVDYQRWTEAGLRKILHSAGFDVQQLELRGGIFVMLGSMVTKVPYQVFGTWKAQHNWLLRLLYLTSWLLTLPLSWFLLLLDPLDRTRAYTTGFSILCCKAPETPGTQSSVLESVQGSVTGSFQAQV